MKTESNTPLVLAFIIIVIIALLFSGGAITMTMMDGEMDNGGMMNNINWMWVPAFVALFLSGLLGWVIFSKKKE
jgi:hypothetical protein